MGGLTNWSRDIFIAYDPSIYHILPQKAIDINKEDGGNKTFTITLCKKCTADLIVPYAFRMISLPSFSYSHARAGFVDIVYNTRAEVSFSCNSTCGNISNVREITYDGANYMACDVLVNQYGANALYVVGIHPDLGEIMDVTGNFTEAG